MPKLSVIVPVYKVEPYINKCIDSILAQTFTDFELILIDDGSPDNCGKICDEYAGKDNRVRVLHVQNGGVSNARNIGIDTATGDIIGFVDSDDYILPEMYREMIEYLERNDLDIVCTDVCVFRGNNERKVLHYPNDKIFSRNEAVRENLIGNIDNSVWNKIYKKEVVADSKFPIKSRYEDVAVIHKWFFRAQKVGYLSKVHYYYRKTEGSFTEKAFNCRDRYDHFKAYKERYEFSKKYCKEAEEKAKAAAVRAALSVVTAESAGCGMLLRTEQEELGKFFSEIGEVKHLNAKNKVLLWAIKNCRLVNKIYGRLSYWSKRFK